MSMQNANYTVGNRTRDLTIAPPKFFPISDHMKIHHFSTDIYDEVMLPTAFAHAPKSNRDVLYVQVHTSLTLEILLLFCPHVASHSYNWP